MRRLSVLITGASGGVGLALYKLLKDDPGYELHLHFRNKASYQRVRSEIAATHQPLLFADLGDPEAIHAMARQLPNIDVLVNNAGRYEAGSFFDTSLDAIEEMLRINYLAPLALTHAAARQMTKHGGGKIINISSGSGSHKGLLPSFGYAASKNGLNFMAQALAKEFAPNNIQIVSVILRFVETKMLEAYRDYYTTIAGKELAVENQGVTIRSAREVAERLRQLIDDPALPNGELIEIR